MPELIVGRGYLPILDSGCLPLAASEGPLRLAGSEEVVKLLADQERFLVHQISHLKVKEIIMPMFQFLINDKNPVQSDERNPAKPVMP